MNGEDGLLMVKEQLPVGFGLCIGVQIGIMFNTYGLCIQ